jgi:hypothetical protein
LPLVRAAAAQLTQRISHLPTRGKRSTLAEPQTA